MNLSIKRVWIFIATIISLKCRHAVIGKTCIGTNIGLSSVTPTNIDLHYQIQIDRYSNCTYVEGNLEITWIRNDTKYDLGYLQHIQQVTGYVLINNVNTKDVILPRLQIIRGQTLLKWISMDTTTYGLLVYDSNISTLQLPALRAILHGSVLGMMYSNVCYLDTINWNALLSAGARNFIIYLNPKQDWCDKCDSICEGGCWAAGKENCQKLSTCSTECTSGLCVGQHVNDCCHEQCVGGCTGPTHSDCEVCQNFNDNGVCKEKCSPIQIYNPTTDEWESNPDGKYIHGMKCVSKCPEPYKNDNGTCVRTCPPTKISSNGECVACSGFCPKICIGHGTVDAQNIDKYNGCNIITGSLGISNATFEGYYKIHPDELFAFLSLKEVTDNIQIDGYHEQFTNLSYFANLSVIGGSLYIEKSSLRSLELKSLTDFYGVVSITGNEHLCYADSVNWRKIQKSHDTSKNVLSNRNHDDCKKDGFVCYKQCDESSGCMGSGPDQCIKCANWSYKDTCLADCATLAKTSKIYLNHESKVCGDCHEECLTSCTTPDSDTCDACINYKNEPFCVSKCSEKQYAVNSTCEPCDEACEGCLGPFDTISSKGCISCNSLAINVSDADVIKCLKLKKTEMCPDGFYPKILAQNMEGLLLQPLAGKTLCQPCHTDCIKCSGPGVHSAECQQCASYKSDEICVNECSINHFADKTNHCVLCSPECRTCFGIGNDKCLECNNYKLYSAGLRSHDNTTSFNCTSECPDDFPYTNGIECSARSEYLFAVVIGTSIFVVMMFVILYCFGQTRKARNKNVQISLLAGFEDTVPLFKTNVSPNMCKIRVIKEAEIHKGSVLGTGEFGQVLKGLWVPENEHCKIPIAIKTCWNMRDSKSSADFMNEAQIMASLDHPNILKLLAVCMTDNLMMITQLMPLGSLLDYVRKYKDKIGSKAIMNWSTQIARGMAYLEERRLVHRDLAARNVLVQSPTSVRITDFGMTKLLKPDTLTYESTGGKAAIKWLAPECIENKIFTSKSDVWAFGVTIWELLTYGTVPYANVKSKDVPILVVSGEKLPQPVICSLDLYAIMLQCWNLKADLRPTFKELTKTLAEMASDPGRYLVIAGDKLLRLPSFTNKEKEGLYDCLEKDIMSETRSVPIVEAERYVEMPKKIHIKEAAVNTENYLEPNPPCALPDPLSYIQFSGMTEVSSSCVDDATNSMDMSKKIPNKETSVEPNDYLEPNPPCQISDSPSYVDFSGTNVESLAIPKDVLKSSDSVLIANGPLFENNLVSLPPLAQERNTETSTPKTFMEMLRQFYMNMINDQTLPQPVKYSDSRLSLHLDDCLEPDPANFSNVV